MERCLRKDEDCPQLELRLGPPGENWGTKNGEEDEEIKRSCRERDETESLISLGNYFSHFNPTSGAKRGFSEEEDCSWTMKNNNGGPGHNHKFSSSTSEKKTPVGSTLSSPWLYSVQNQQPRGAEVAKLQNGEENGGPANASVPNNPQKSKRTGPASVVGWPPIRSFRKNLAALATTSKPSPELQNGVPNNKFNSEKPVETSHKGLFVKINMDGVPIGRKVDLKAYESYEKLASAVDELFRGLLAAQGNSLQEGEKAITGLLDGSGEYTLVYQDNEGDRMLVGDVPWRMFVSTVKRLRVLKSSELSTIGLGK